MKQNLGNLMRQAQQIQESMQKAQAELVNLEVTGEAGGGMVKVTMNGRHEVRQVRIDDSLFSAEGGVDREMLEDLVAAASNDAVQKVEAKVQEKFSGMMSGVALPPGMKLPWG